MSQITRLSETFGLQSWTKTGFDIYEIALWRRQECHGKDRAAQELALYALRNR